MSSKPILALIDTDPAFQSIVKVALQDSYTVEIFEDPRSLITTYQDSSPILYIIDVPTIQHSASWFKVLMEHPRLKDVPLIYTAYNEEIFDKLPDIPFLTEVGQCDKEMLLEIFKDGQMLRELTKSA